MDELTNVLIVDPSASDRDRLQEVIQQSEYQWKFRFVQSKVELLEAISQFAPAIVLSEVSLPDLNVLEVINIVKEYSIEIPIIIVTQSVNEDAAVNTLSAGASNYVLKSHLKRLVPSIVMALKEIREKRKKARAKKELEQSKEWLSIAITGTGLGIWNWDIELIFMN